MAYLYCALENVPRMMLEFLARRSSVKSRRQFITLTSLGLLGAAAAQAQSQNPSQPTPGAPPAFGTAPEVGPEVTTTTFAEAEKLMQFELTASERSVAAESWR